MEEAIDHPLFSPRKTGSGIETFRMDSKDMSLAIPTVTVRRRRSKNRNHPCAGVAFGMKALIILAPIYFYKQIFDISLSSFSGLSSSPVIRRDYSTVRSIHDLDSSRIKQWCQRAVYDCKCKDPMIPFPRDSDTSWQKQHGLNVEMANRNATTDVVFYGDSIVEYWNKHDHKNVFESFFSKKKGGEYDGTALGIANDRSRNLLWRIQNGELPHELKPKVFWVLIGTQDLGLTFCSPELVVIGVIRIVEEIISRTHISCEIVINALFPRTFNKEGFVDKGGPVNPSVWPEIKAINDELKLYATYRDRVVFFESKSFFENPTAPPAQLKIDKALMDDYFHLTKKGYQKWGNEITEKLHSMKTMNKQRLKGQEEETPP